MGAKSLSKANQSCYLHFPLPNITLMKMIIVIHHICRALLYTSSQPNHKTAFRGRHHSPILLMRTSLEPKWYLNSGFLFPPAVLFHVLSHLETGSLKYSDRNKILEVWLTILELPRRMLVVTNNNLLLYIIYICSDKY